MAAVRLRERAKLETIQVRDAAGVRKMSVAQVLEASRGRTSLADLAVMSSKADAVDLATLASGPSRSSAGGLDAAPTRPAIEMLRDAPRIEGFVGRGRELALITEDPEGPRLIVVRGIAGMGKSCLAAKACDLLRGKRNLFWHRIRSWDTRKFVLAHLGEFLSALGKPGLRSILMRGESERAPEVLRTDLPGTHAFLVFDDAQEATTEVLQLLTFLKEVLADAPDVRALICTRRALPGFGQRDLLQALVHQIELEGLPREEVLRFLEAHEVPEEVLVLGGKIGGHPLSLRLLQSAKGIGALLQSRRSLRLLIEEEVYRDLSEAERTMMKVASLYRVPVPREALFGGPGLSHDVLMSLAERSLLRPVGLDGWEAHDSIRAFFAELLTPSEHTILGRFAARQLRALAETARAEWRLEASINYLSNALLVATSERERVDFWEELGDAHVKTGNLPEALTAYGEVIRRAKEAERGARAHRKSALAYCAREEYLRAERELEAAEAALQNRRGAEWGWIEFARGQIDVGEDRWEEAAKRAEQAVRTFRRLRDQVGQAQALCLQGFSVIHQSGSNLALGERCFEEAMALSEQIGDPGLSADVHIELTHFFALHAADSERALQHLRRIEDSQDVLADPMRRSNFLWFKGLVDLELRAEYEEAEGDFLEMERLSRKIYNPSGILRADYGRALTLYFRSRLGEAQKVFDDTWMESRSRGWLAFDIAAKSLWMAGACCLRSGDLKGFRRLAAVSNERDFPAHVDERSIVDKVLRGVDLLVQGDRTGAEDAFANALGSAEKASALNEIPHQYLSYLAPLVYGCALRAAGRDSEADEYLDRAKGALQAYRMIARLSVFSEEERQLVATLRNAQEAILAKAESRVNAQ